MPAFNEDEMNSALGIICSELERQGYKIEIEDIKVTSKKIFENKVPALEKVPAALKLNYSEMEKRNRNFQLASLIITK